LTLYPFYFFLFSSILSTSSMMKKRVAIFNWLLLSIFGSGLILKSLEAVISSGEIWEISQIVRILTEGSAEIGNTFWELVSEVGGTKPGTDLGMLFT
jgi:maltodextrin utilization protein YvdJ